MGNQPRLCQHPPPKASSCSRRPLSLPPSHITSSLNSLLCFPLGASLPLFPANHLSLPFTSTASSRHLTRESPLSSRFLSDNNYRYPCFYFWHRCRSLFIPHLPYCPRPAQNRVGNWNSKRIFETEEQSFTVRSVGNGLACLPLSLQLLLHPQLLMEYIYSQSRCTRNTTSSTCYTRSLSHRFTTTS